MPACHSALPVALAGLALTLPLLASPALASPVVCTTTLEAPPTASAGSAPAAPVEVTRCDTVQTVPQLVERRFYTWSAPFAQSVSLTNQITDLFGIATGGVENRVMGLGFRDQTIIWDGTAVQNTYQVLLEQQSDPMPWRTGDVSNGFSGSLSGGAQTTTGSWQDGEASWSAPVRGLW